jgi:hypothetical protein
MAHWMHAGWGSQGCQLELCAIDAADIGVAMHLVVWKSFDWRRGQERGQKKSNSSDLFIALVVKCNS